MYISHNGLIPLRNGYKMVHYVFYLLTFRRSKKQAQGSTRCVKLSNITPSRFGNVWKELGHVLMGFVEFWYVWEGFESSGKAIC